MKERRVHVDRLVAWRAEPPHSPRARIVIVHGICEHSGRHLNTVEALVKENYEVVRFDLRGAGESGGERQWISNFQDYVDDVAAINWWITRELPPLPLYLLGHSLGGAIALTFVAQYPSVAAGLLVSAPAYRTGDAIPQWLIWIGKRAVGLLPHLRVPSSPDHSALSRDPKVAIDYAADPLVCHFNTLQQGDQILKGLAMLPSHCRAIQCPTVILHATLDRVVLCEGSYELFTRLGTDDRVLHLLPGSFHEPHNDIDKTSYYQLITRWLAKHCR